MLARTPETRLDFAGTPFMSSSNVNVNANRLNWRAEVLIARMPDAIVGKRVLDLGSHDGRFSYAALACGAKYVLGVEAREKHVEHARRNLLDRGIAPSQFDFAVADLVPYLRTIAPGTFDTVFCFGLFSHLIEQVEVLREIRRLAPAYLLIDTWVAKEKLNLLERLRNQKVNAHVAHTQLGRRRGKRTIGSLMRSVKELWGGQYRTGTLVLLYENASADGATIREGGLMAWASESAISMLLEYYGFDHELVKWRAQGIRDWTYLEDYKDNARKTWIARLPVAAAPGVRQG